MQFIYPLMLAGVVLTAVPILLHLIMQQQPRQLPFPAFRFLKLKHKTTARKLQLKHLLLLALRILLILCMCLALARPKLFSERFQIGGEQPVALVVIIDTSMSMEYTVKSATRLDEAKQRAKELIDELADGSRVAIVDSAEPGDEWSADKNAAKQRVDALTLRAANRPITGALPDAFRLLDRLTADSDAAGAENLRRFIFVLSDRTANSFDAQRTPDLIKARERLGEPAPQMFWVDVGVDKPIDLALTQIELPQQTVPANQPVTLRVTVQATGRDAETEVLVRWDGEAKPEPRPVKLTADTAQVLVFERPMTALGLHQAEVTLATTDALPFDNVRYATVEVRGPRRVLILTDEPTQARFLRLALEKFGAFAPEIQSANDANLQQLNPAGLEAYQVVCLLSVANPNRWGLWEKLERYVTDGGRLAVFPGGPELVKDAYTKPESARKLLPGVLTRYARVDEPGLTWQDGNYTHPIVAPFRGWALRGDVDFLVRPRRVLHYWQVPGYRQEGVVAAYADADKHPAILETIFERNTLRGKVLLFTTPFDGRRDTVGVPVNDYIDSSTSFYLVVTNLALGYLAGDSDPVVLNFPNGPAVMVPIPLTPRFPVYSLKGPGVQGSEAVLTRADNAGELRITQTATAGNFTVTGGARQWTAGYSLNPPSEECSLERVPVETIEALLGPNSVLMPGREKSLQEALSKRFNAAVELFPLLMVVLLFVLAIENWFANRFYRPVPMAETPGS